MHMSKMGRPKSDNNKDKIVAVRLTEEEHQRLTMYAKKHSLKMSDVLKNGLYEVLNKQIQITTKESLGGYQLATT